MTRKVKVARFQVPGAFVEIPEDVDGAFDPAGSAALAQAAAGVYTDASIAAHKLEADPHPQYLTAAEGAAAFDPLGAAAAKVVDSIADADTTRAPSRNAVFDALALKADLASPAFTGNPTAPTAAPGDNDISLATTAFVAAAVAAGGGGGGGLSIGLALQLPTIPTFF